MSTSVRHLPKVRPDSRVQAVVLDWGGVMSNSGRAGQVGENLAARLGLAPEVGKQLVAEADHDLKRGLADENDFWRRIETAVGFVPEDRRDIWIPAEDLAPDIDMVVAVSNLRAFGYRVGLLTNTHPAASAAVASIGGYDGFDAVVASNLSRSHSAKPDAAAYREILDALGVAPSAALFVDDQDKALRGATAVGMHVLKANPTSGRFPTDLLDNLHAELQRLNQPWGRSGGSGRLRATGSGDSLGLAGGDLPRGSARFHRGASAAASHNLGLH